jgi:hypothetical protein
VAIVITAVMVMTIIMARVPSRIMAMAAATRLFYDDHFLFNHTFFDDFGFGFLAADCRSSATTNGCTNNGAILATQLIPDRSARSATHSTTNDRPLIHSLGHTGCQQQRKNHQNFFHEIFLPVKFL